MTHPAVRGGGLGGEIRRGHVSDLLADWMGERPALIATDPPYAFGGQGDEHGPTPSALVKHWPALTAQSLERVDRKQLDRELAQQRSEQQLLQALEGR
jgi:hypothetical protein